MIAPLFADRGLEGCSAVSLRMQSFVALALLAGLVSGAEVKTTGGAGVAAVSVVRRVDLEYHLLTRSAPLEFEVEGPTWLRVYSRLWWPANAQGLQSYRLTLWQDDAERPEQFDVGLSSSSFGPDGRRVSQWRSFFLQVPAGPNRYRLVLDRSPAETVGVRFAFQSPRPWRSVELAGLPVLELESSTMAGRFWRVAPNRPAMATIDGPCRVQVRVRLNYDASLAGRQGLVLTATVDGRQQARQGFQVWRSDGATWRGVADLVPSTPRTMRFNLPEGKHEISLLLSGTLAKSAGLAVEYLPVEKYE